MLPEAHRRLADTETPTQQSLMAENIAAYEHRQRERAPPAPSLRRADIDELSRCRRKTRRRSWTLRRIRRASGKPAEAQYQDMPSWRKPRVSIRAIPVGITPPSGAESYQQQRDLPAPGGAPASRTRSAKTAGKASARCTKCIACRHRRKALRCV
ncbi:hypothetical protein M8494_06380 [Serratia ureilytica]